MKILKIIGNVFFILVLAVSGLFFLAHFTKVLPLRIFIVSSGSMEPAIKTGSLVVTLPSSSYAVGDIVTFKSGPKNTTTHRLVAAGDGKYKTAGDANNQPDSALLSSDQILGRVALFLPYLGYLAAFAKTPPGFILFVIVPATIIVYEELKNLVGELKKRMQALRTDARSRTPLAGVEHVAVAMSNPRHPNTPALAIIVPIFFAAFILITVRSISYFSDTETSSNNSFTAFVTTPTPTIPAPTPTPHPVINELAPAATGNDEWIEIYNPSSSPLDLSGWKISDNTEEDVIPTVTPIPANGYGVVMASDGNSALIPVGAIPLILSDTTVGGNLANGGDRVILKTPSSTTIDQMSWGTDTFAFLVPPGEPSASQSLARSPNGTDTDTAADWIIDASPSIGVSN